MSLVFKLQQYVYHECTYFFCVIQKFYKKTALFLHNIKRLAIPKTIKRQLEIIFNILELHLKDNNLPNNIARRLLDVIPSKEPKIKANL